MKNFFWAFCFFNVLVMLNGSQALPPPADCTSQVYNLISCLSFVEVGSKDTNPETSCCSSLDTLLKESPLCLCEIINGDDSFGIPLNITRATQLPSACSLTSSPLSACKVSATPPPKSHFKPSQSPTLLPPSPSPSASSSKPGSPNEGSAGRPGSPPSGENGGAPNSSFSASRAFSTYLLVSLVSLAVATLSCS